MQGVPDLLDNVQSFPPRCPRRPDHRSPLHRRRRHCRRYRRQIPASFHATSNQKEILEMKISRSFQDTFILGNCTTCSLRSFQTISPKACYSSEWKIELNTRQLLHMNYSFPGFGFFSF